jgi:hypothetical protein
MWNSPSGYPPVQGVLPHRVLGRSSFPESNYARCKSEAQSTQDFRTCSRIGRWTDALVEADKICSGRFNCSSLAKLIIPITPEQPKNIDVDTKDYQLSNEHLGSSIYDALSVSCIFHRFQCQNTADCSEIPRTGGVRGGRDWNFEVGNYSAWPPGRDFRSR